MLIFPAIDLINGQAVRLYKGDYDNKTVYSNSPVEVAKEFKKCGATHIHIVDLDGAKSGLMPNFDVVVKIKKETGLFCEIGGGIRTFEAIEKYINSGIDRVILGTVAVKNPEFVKMAVEKYGEKIAVGIDVMDYKVAIKGWTENSGLDMTDFCERMQSIGVKTIICTDISKDGAMEGTNRKMYKDLSKKFSIDIVASGGVSTIKDVEALRKLDLYAAIIGKAYYIGAISLTEAIEVAK